MALNTYDKIIFKFEKYTIWFDRTILRWFIVHTYYQGVTD